MIGGSGHHGRPALRHLDRRGRVELAVLAGLVGMFAVVGVAALRTDPLSSSAASEHADVEPELALVELRATGAVTTPFGDGGRWSTLIVTTESALDPAAEPVRRVAVDVGSAMSHRAWPDRTWRGVGAALTDSAVELIAGRPDAISLLFDPSLPGGAGLDLVRLPLSGTDFSMRSWTWALEDGVITPTPEALAAVAVVDDLLAVQPDLAVVAAAWSSPPEMRTDPSSSGGALVDVEGYGAFLAAQVAWLVDRGVPLSGLSLGNEPGHVADSPTLAMSDAQMVALSRELRPELDRGGVELFALDHNWSDAARAVDLVDNGAFDAAAFHCYDGSPQAMAVLDVPVFVSECTATTGAWHESVGWMARELVGESIRAGSTGLVMWNLALDPDHGPKQPGGCVDCRGLLTIDPIADSMATTPEFSVLAHLAAAADPGAAILDLEKVEGLPLAAFANPDGTLGIFGHNDRPEPISITIHVPLPASRTGAGATLHVHVDSWGIFSVRAPLDQTVVRVAGG